MSRKIYTILSLLLVVAFALSACGTPATDAPAQPAAATDAPAATEAPAGTVTVNWWHIGTAIYSSAIA